jgi:ribosomal protein S12 methylthiotransferase
MAVQQEIAFAFGDSLIGYEVDCLIDEQLDDETWSGRTYADAPEIDGSVLIGGTGLEVGARIPVEIAGRQDYDLIGVPAE